MKRTSSFTCFDKNSNHPIACICPDSPASVALNFKLWMRLAHPNAFVGKFPVTTKYSRTYYRGKASLRTSSAFNFLRSKPGSKQGSSEAPVVSLKVLRIQIFRLFPRLFSSDAFSKKSLQLSSGINFFQFFELHFRFLFSFFFQFFSMDFSNKKVGSSSSVPACVSFVIQLGL